MWLPLTLVNVSPSDYPTVEAIEAALVSIPPRKRDSLVILEYATVRAQQTDGHIPSQAELEGLLRDMVGCYPGLIAVRIALALIIIAVFVAVAVDSYVDGFHGAWVPLALAAFFFMLVTLNLSWVLGPRGKAMRLLAESRGQTAQERHRMLLEAVALDPGKPGEPFRLGR